MTQRRNTHPRAGRPAGPDQDRASKSYDPRRTTSTREKIVLAVFKNQHALTTGQLLLCDLAASIGTSISYLSIVKNSTWGQNRLKQLAYENAELVPGEE